MEYKVVSNIKQFALLKKNWNMVFNSRPYSVFQSFTFNYYSWKYILDNSSKNKLYIVQILEDSFPIGFFPLYIDNKNKLRFINDIHADFCDIILSKDIDFSDLFKFILYDCKNKVIQLINLKEDSLIVNFSFANNFSNLRVSSFEKYTELKVERGIFPENCRNLLCKERSEIRRIVKKNQDCNHVIIDKSLALFPRNEILELKERMIKNGDRRDDFLPISQLNLIEMLYNNNQLEISLTRDSKIRAILFVLINSQNLLLWIDLYDRNSYTSTLYNYISYIGVKSLGVDICVNFGRGAYKWKLAKFRPEILDLYSVTIFSNKFSYLVNATTSYILMIFKLIYRKIK
ncbi:MAG: hypothetical protein CMD14_08345 [Flavobacteriales bacterium]|nr:hypothetical protein [Flavobacteriales bacterium]|tara:strand:- start:40752 stop:41786 length:1035 start_codon:yes stop_codon:yes gene_type:complete